MALTLVGNDPVAVALGSAIRSGDVGALEQLLAEHPGLASARIVRRAGRSRTPLHVAADWPGFFPDGAAVVRALIASGADVNARTEGPSPETPLHWAASSDDRDVAEALLEAGADVGAAGGSIGTPLDNAIGYGCWQVARLLVARGARVDRLWHAAALGMMDRLVALLATEPAPSAAEVNEAFWQACHGGQRRTAEYLLARGAEINFVPPYNQHTPLAIATSVATRWDSLAIWLRDQGARA